MIRDGIINLLKPAGMTSHDGVSMLRRLTGIKRIGHTGTLDPMAVGVLPLCIGSAARITEYLDLDLKQYRCEMQLGIETDTQDIWGEVLTHMPDRIPQEKNKIEQVLSSFQGLISQYPPNYSAVRVNGKRLYEYARNGEQVEVKPREVYVKNITVVHCNTTTGKVLFDVTCSKGTYIRAICHDTGRALGCGAAMSFLVRTASGAFDLNHTVTIEEMKINGVEPYLLEPDFPLVHFGKGFVHKDRGKWFANGGHLRISEVTISKEPTYLNVKPHIEVRPEYREAYNIYLADENSQNNSQVFIGVAFYHSEEKKLVADKIFANDRSIFD